MDVLDPEPPDGVGFPGAGTDDRLLTAAHLFRRCQQIAVGLFFDECRDIDITPLQFAVLRALSIRGAMDQTTLGGLIALDRTTTAVVVRRLEATGRVVRQRSPHDRRAKLVALTDEGTRVLSDLQRRVRHAESRMLAPLDENERALLIAYLLRIAESNNAFSRAPVRDPDD